ncbi:MAG: DUF2798 domain-containing protein [Geminicoccaceae bacterium]
MGWTPKHEGEVSGSRDRAGLRLPAWLQPYLFGLVLSGLMSLVVAGVSTFRAVGLPPDFTALWMSAWLTSWVIAFPTVLVVAPVVRRMVGRLT